MLNIAYRNLKLFVRDKANMFFSFLGVIIIIGLYLLFLGDILIKSFDEIDGAKFLMDSWVMAGVVAVTSITTTLGAFGIMVEDRHKKLLKDFNAAPLKRYKIAGGYILSTFVIGVASSLLSFIFAEIFIVAKGGEMLTLIPMLKMIGLILLTVLASSAMMYFIVSFFSSNNAFAGASTVIGTLAGFITGVYMPVGQFHESVQMVIKVFPTSHGAALMRQVMTEVPIEQSFSSIPESARTAAIEDFQKLMGVTFHFGDYVMPAGMSILILVATAVIFYILAVLSVSRKRKK